MKTITRIMNCWMMIALVVAGLLILYQLWFPPYEPVKRDMVHQNCYWIEDTIAIKPDMVGEIPNVNTYFVRSDSNGDVTFYYIKYTDYFPRPRNSPPDSGLKDFRRER